jgi:hypothetical protein
MTNLVLPPIAMFWMGPAMGWMQRLSMHSFVNHGYKVTLFTSEPLDPKVKGVEVARMEDIYDPPRRMRNNAAPACIADVFRLYLMKKTDFVWMDSDMLSIAPVTLNEGYAMSWSGPKGQINNAALRVPKTSAALDYLLAHIEDPEMIPEWMSADQQDKLRQLPPERRLLAQGKMLRIVYGPRGLNHALGKTGEHAKARPMEVFSPVPWWLTDLFYSPLGGVEPYVTPATQVVHLFQDQTRKWNLNHPLPKGCFLDRYVTESGFVI